MKGRFAKSPDATAVGSQPAGELGPPRSARPPPRSCSWRSSQWSSPSSGPRSPRPSGAGSRAGAARARRARPAAPDPPPRARHARHGAPIFRSGMKSGPNVLDQVANSPDVGVGHARSGRIPLLNGIVAAQTRARLGRDRLDWTRLTRPGQCSPERVSGHARPPGSRRRED